MGNVVIAQNLVKTTERININGDVINPITKQIIKPAEVPYVQPVKTETTEAVQPPTTNKPNFCPNCGTKL